MFVPVLLKLFATRHFVSSFGFFISSFWFFINTQNLIMFKNSNRLLLLFNWTLLITSNFNDSQDYWLTMSRYIVVTPNIVRTKSWPESCFALALRTFFCHITWTLFASDRKEETRLESWVLNCQVDELSSVAVNRDWWAHLALIVFAASCAYCLIFFSSPSIRWDAAITMICRPCVKLVTRWNIVRVSLNNAINENY